MNESLASKKYIWWKDRKIIGIILLIIACIMQIFAFLKVPFISSIHGYTIGMLMGFLNPLFYFFIIVKAGQMILNNKVKVPSWIKISTNRYILIAFTIIFASVATSYYQNQISYQGIGVKYWDAFDSWFTNFTDAPAWLPNNTNGGLIGAFLFAFIAMICSGIGAFVIAIILLITVLIVLFGHNLKTLIKKHQLVKHPYHNVGDKPLDYPPYKRPASISVTQKMPLSKKTKQWDININPTKKVASLKTIPTKLSTKNKMATKQQVTQPLFKPKSVIKEANNSNTLEIDLPFEDPFI